MTTIMIVWLVATVNPTEIAVPPSQRERLQHVGMEPYGNLSGTFDTTW